ncbi:MAG: aspartate kinase [Myxococcota bacterium]
MRLVVQKFGASSLGDAAGMTLLAERVLEARQRGDASMVVVSAMTSESERLTRLAQSVSDRPDARELDTLLSAGDQVSAALAAMALRRRGVDARSVSAAQLRLETDLQSGASLIRAVDRLGTRRALARGQVIVATGFQGVDVFGNLVGFGRGGSDVSAIALAVALGAAECEMYTDAPGIFTADPSICPRARLLPSLGYEEMMELDHSVARRPHPRAVELAMRHNVPMRVRSVDGNGAGTLITHEKNVLERLQVRAISHNADVAKVTVRRVPDKPGIAAQIFVALAREPVGVDLIVQSPSERGTTDVVFTVSHAEAARAHAVVADVARRIGAGEIELDDEIAKLSIVGAGMRAQPGAPAIMFEALAHAGINVHVICASDIKISCLVARADLERAVRELHESFGLRQEPATGGESKRGRRRPRRPRATRHGGRR